MPTLILHGDDDQIVPIGAAAMLSSKLVKGAVLKVIPGAPHGMSFDTEGPDQRRVAGVFSEGGDGGGVKAVNSRQLKVESETEVFVGGLWGAR